MSEFRMYAQPLGHVGRGSNAAPFVPIAWLASGSVIGLGWMSASIPVSEWPLPTLLAACALLPFLLWARNPKRFGIPLLPLWTSTLVVTYAYPLFRPNDVVSGYTSSARDDAALLIAGCCLMATVSWQLATGFRGAGKGTSLESPVADRVFLGALACFPVYFYFGERGYFDFLGPFNSVVRALILGTNNIALFYMGLRWGRRALSPVFVVLTMVLITISTLVSLTTIFMVGSIYTWLFVCVGFFLGRHKLPLILVSVALVGFTILQLGKAQMRAECWSSKCQAQSSYVGFFNTWLQYSWNEIVDPKGETKEFNALSLMERVQLVQLFLLVQSESPQHIRYLGGDSYAVIPELMVPRIINDERANTHEGTTLLNIHYGLQTRESTLTTTIGWGLFNEAYANFGPLGVFALSAFMGGGLGWAAARAKNQALTSINTLICFVLLSQILNTEASMGVFVTATIQSLVALFMIQFVLHTLSRFSATARAHGL